MIELENDPITLIYKKGGTKLRRSFRMDKKSGEVRITDYDIITNEAVNDIRCDVFELDSFKNIDKYVELKLKELIGE